MCIRDSPMAVGRCESVTSFGLAFGRSLLIPLTNKILLFFIILICLQNSTIIHYHRIRLSFRQLFVFGYQQLACFYVFLSGQHSFFFAYTFIKVYVPALPTPLKHYNSDATCTTDWVISMVTPVSYTHLDVYKRQAYLIDRNVQVAGYTHSNKSHKRKMHLKQLTHNNYHCKEKCRNKPSIRNTTQNCDSYNINYTHGKYLTSDNYNNDNYNCNYKNYRGYHKRRKKKQSTAVYIGLKQTDPMQHIHDERIMERREEERERLFVTSGHTVNTHNKGMQDGSGKHRLIYDNGYYTSRNNIFPVEGYNAIVKLERDVESNDTPNSMLYCNE